VYTDLKNTSGNSNSGFEHFLSTPQFLLAVRKLHVTMNTTFQELIGPSPGDLESTPEAIRTGLDTNLSFERTIFFCRKEYFNTK